MAEAATNIDEHLGVLVAAGNRHVLNTDVGVFPSDWELKELGEIGQPLAGLTYSPTDVNSDGTLVLRSSNVQNSHLAFENNVFVRMDIPDRAIVRKGDILICVRNGSRELIGKCALIDERAAGMAFGAFMGVFRSELNGFIFYAFQTDYVQRQIREHLGATINQITSKSLRSFKIALPRDPEEIATIVMALNDADAQVVVLEQLIEKKRLIKQGAMQDLLSGRKRLPGFNGEWVCSRLGDRGAFFKGSGVRRDQAQSGELPCVRYGELYTHYGDVIRSFFSKISDEVAATARKIVRGDILFAGSGETKEEIGKCAVLDGAEYAFAGGDIIVFRPRGDDPQFLAYYLNSVPVQAQKAAKGQGDAVVHITSRALSDLEIRLPRRDEQEAIARTLLDMDADLFALEARLEKARQIEQGMMQELLTGRVRLV